MIKRIIGTACIFCFCMIGHANQWHDEADRCWNEARKLKKDRRYGDAIEYLKRAVIAERKNEHPRVEELVAQLNELGGLYEIQGQYDRSLHYYRLMLKAAAVGNDRRQEALAFNNIGQTISRLNRLDESLDSFRQGLDIARAGKFADTMALVLNNMAGVFRLKKDFAAAMERYREALDAAREGSPANVAVITSNIGTMLYYQREFDRALEAYAEAMELDRSAGRREYLSVDLSNMGAVYAAQGKYGEALTYLEKALEIDNELNNDANRAARHFRLGEINLRLGDTVQAIEQYQRSLEINLRMNNSVNAAQVQSSMGLAYESMGKDEEALEYYIKALSANRDIDQKEHIALRLSDIGHLYETRERFGEAIDYLGKALLSDMVSNKKSRIAAIMSNIGRVMCHLKRYDRAIDYFRQSHALYRELGDGLAMADDLKNSGIAHYHLKRYDMTIDLLGQALTELAKVKVVDAARRDVENDVYRWLVATYVRAGRPDMAFEINDRSSLKRVSFPISDRMMEEPDRKVNCETVQKTLGKNAAAVAFVNTAWDQPLVLVVDSASASGLELDKMSLVNQVYTRKGKSIEDFSGMKKTGISFSVHQKLRRDLYYVEFENIINYYRHLLGKKYVSGDEFATMKYLGEALYQFLFGSIEKSLAGKDELIIQPEGALSLIPFETLRMPDGRYLAEKYSVRYRYSHAAAMLGASRGRVKGGKTVLAVSGGVSAVPAKKNVESSRHFDIIVEAATGRIIAGKGIAEIYGFFNIDSFGDSLSGKADAEAVTAGMPGSTVLSGTGASEEAIRELSRKGALAEYRIIHFSSGAVVVPEVPQLAAVTVTPESGNTHDGLLNIREIRSLAVRADMVHLAALNLPKNGFSRGEGVWQLGASFIEAGARGVTISLWPVDPVTGSDFMKQVYRLVLDRGIGFEKALAQTKRSFIDGMFGGGGEMGRDSSRGGSMKYANPYSWGSVVLYGY